MQRTTGSIGVVGLGGMGGRIAGRLLSLGHEVYGTNRTRTKADALIERGLIWCDSPRETAASADVVISMVTDGAALEAVTAGPDGILAGLRAGTIYLDMSTVSPQTSRELARRVGARGAAMLAAPVSGSLPAAEQGSLAVIADGDPDAFERVEPILRQLGRTVSFVGDNGHALLLKLAINISLGVQMLAFSEGLLLAERGGVERQVALDVLTSSAIGSPMLQARAPLLLELPDQAWFDVAQMQKDIRLALDSAGELKVPLPSTAVVDQVLSAARTHGYAHRDIAVVLRVLTELAETSETRVLESATR
jgi:3-hydroxyisobutyrate dehydrogenase-like beta-hydroxyacid dehydrogenase